MRPKLNISLIFFLFIYYCGCSDLPHTNPHDPKSPDYKPYKAPDPVFPRSSTPSGLTVVDLELCHESSACNLEEKVLASTLQGVVNAKVPRMYVVEGKKDTSQAFWLEVYKEGYNIEYSEPVSLWDALDTFAGEPDGMVIYSMDEPYTVNLATTMAGIENAIAVSPSLMDRLSAYDLEVVDDLRDRWKDKYEAYRWAFENLYPLCNEDALAVLNTDDWRLRDYLVEFKVFTFYLKAVKDDKALLEDILSNTPYNIPVFGYMASTAEEEMAGALTLATYNKFLIPSDTTANLSVHSGLPRPEVRMEQSHEPIPSADLDGKLVITAAFTDGDNLNIPLHRYPQERYWLNEERGKVPVGWSYAMGMLDLAPGILRYYLSSMNEADEFVATIGIGYAHPSFYPDLSTFARLTGEYARFEDAPSFWTIDPLAYFPENSELDKMLRLFMEEGGFAGVIAGYLPTASGEYITASGVPLLTTYLDYDANIEKGEDEDHKLRRDYVAGVIQGLADGLRPESSIYAFLGLGVWKLDYNDLLAIHNRVSHREEIIFVTPEVALSLFGKTRVIPNNQTFLASQNRNGLK